MNNGDRTLRPEGWDQFVGQHEAKARLDLAINAALADCRPMSDLLITGPPGTGKTTIANLIAERLHEKVALVVRPVTTDELGEILWELGAGILYVDECHRLPADTQETLNQLLEERRFVGHKIGSWSVSWLQVIASTTEAHKILKPLFTRFMLRPAWGENYSESEMGEIVAGMAVRAGVTLDPEACLVLARGAAGAPRTARLLVLTARDLAPLGPIDPFQVLRAAQISEDGLSRDHVQYLEVVDSLGGCAGLRLTSDQMRRHPEFVANLERLLFERRLITVGPKGRQLTARARARLRAA